MPGFIEKTPHDGKYNGLQNQLCFATIVASNPDNRTYDLITIGHPQSRLKDLKLTNVKQLSQSSNAVGDEAFSIMRVNTMVVVVFVESRPFIVGAFQPDTNASISAATQPTTNTAAANNQASTTGPFAYQNLSIADTVFNGSMNVGDHGWSTQFGNYFLIRNFGLMEMVSTPNLKTFWDPQRDFLQSFCQNYDLQTNGGEASWDTDDTTGNTTLSITIQDNVAPTRIMTVDAGTVEGGEVLSIKTGPPDEGLNVSGTPEFSLDILNGGETKMSVNAMVNFDFLPSGNGTLDFGGTLAITIAQTCSITSQGDMSLTSQANVNITAMQNVIVACQQFLANAKSGGNKLGAGASYSIPLGELLLQALQAMVLTYNTHSHLYVFPLIPLPGPPVPTTPPIMPMVPPMPTILSMDWKVQ